MSFGQLDVSIVGHRLPTFAGTFLAQSNADFGGSTSIRNVPADNLKLKSQGYFMRNRDLGQVFTSPATTEVERLIVRLGPSSAAVLANTIGQEVFVQWFRIEGSPMINNNGTPPGMEALHGYFKNHRGDDFVEGVRYVPLTTMRGGVFPNLPPTRNADNSESGDTTAQLQYIQFSFAPDQRITLLKGEMYAWLIGLVNPTPAAGFTLANYNRASNPADVPLEPAAESQVGGWGIRREGNGHPEPTIFSDSFPSRVREASSAQPSLFDQMTAEAMFASGDARWLQSPQTIGYPDVDTYRDFEFYLVAPTLTIERVKGPPMNGNICMQQPIRDDVGPTSFRFYAPRIGPPTKSNTLAYDPNPSRSDAEINAVAEARYYYRDRDLGQTFTTGDDSMRLDAITVRLQPVDVANADPSGARVSVQLMRVRGAPKINNNGTIPGAASPYGNPRWATYAFKWPDDPRDATSADRRVIKAKTDDFIEGEVYEHLALFSGGIIPKGLQTDDYLRWSFVSDANELTLAPNTTYAILFLFDAPAPQGVKRNIPLSNRNVVPVDGVETPDIFPGGHMIRREGSSVLFDEVFIASDAVEDVEVARQSATFPKALDKRLAIPPGTLGYPDVDTYRELTFWLECL